MSAPRRSVGAREPSGRRRRDRAALRDRGCDAGGQRRHVRSHGHQRRRQRHQFESPLPASVTPGTAGRTSIQSFAGLGATGNQFGGNLLRSETGNVVPVTLTNLGPHSSVNLAFLFAAIDSLDGAGAFPAGDFFRITLDGVTIFREAFSNALPTQVRTGLHADGHVCERRRGHPEPRRRVLGHRHPAHLRQSRESLRDGRRHGRPSRG
ncbi:MAG: hypothetical protein ACK52I_20200 [Pseudomonadota bacterium]